MYCNFFLKDARGGVNVRNLSQRRWISLLHKPVHEIMQSGFQFQCCLSLLDHVRVISLILPLAWISLSQEKQKYVLHHSHWVRVFWLPVKKCEANSSSPVPGFTQYMIHSTGKYCELTHLLSVTVNSFHSFFFFLHTVHAHTVYSIYKKKYIQHLWQCPNCKFCYKLRFHKCEAGGSTAVWYLCGGGELICRTITRGC